jgi:hypothetical protein
VRPSEKLSFIIFALYLPLEHSGVCVVFRLSAPNFWPNFLRLYKSNLSPELPQSTLLLVLKPDNVVSASAQPML